MSHPTSEGIWERIRGGRHGALVGLAMPAVPGDIRAIRVSCDVPPSTFGPLLEARRRIEAVLGEDVPLVSQARERVVSGLRRHLFGELPQTGTDAVLVEVANRLAQQCDRNSVLIFDVVEAADEATLATLRELLLRPHWLRLPMLLVFRTRHPTGLAGALLDTLLRVEGFAAVIQAREERTEVARVSWQGLRPEIIEVLRAGAVIGAGFEVELVARLLEISPLEVLLRLQAAADTGAPIEDRGEGRIHLSEAWIRGLRDGILPSLARLWHHRLGALLAGGEGEDEGERVSDAMEAAAGLVGGPADRELLAEVRAEAAAVDARDEARTEPRAPDTVVSAPRRPSLLEEVPAPRGSDAEAATEVAAASEAAAEAMAEEAAPAEAASVTDQEVQEVQEEAPAAAVVEEAQREGSGPRPSASAREGSGPRPSASAREGSGPRPSASVREGSGPRPSASAREGSGPRPAASMQEAPEPAAPRPPSPEAGARGRSRLASPSAAPRSRARGRPPPGGRRSRRGGRALPRGRPGGGERRRRGPGARPRPPRARPPRGAAELAAAPSDAPRGAPRGRADPVAERRRSPIPVP
ncbi:MAG: hypothetical protein H6711_03420 [Myxococcales bacterium]|nr:hypothetical protein [Myxococcales bacterium]